MVQHAAPARDHSMGKAIGVAFGLALIVVAGFGVAWIAIPWFGVIIMMGAGGALVWFLSEDGDSEQSTVSRAMD